jgi:hypothetical protein
MALWPEPKIAPQPAGAEEPDETGDANIGRKRGKPKGKYWPRLVKLFQDLNDNTPGAFNTPNGSQKNVSQLMGDVRKKWEKSWPPLPKKTALRTAINDALKLIDRSPA